MSVVSINVAVKTLLNIGNKEVETGIFKKPCRGSVCIGERGVDGDNIVDTEVHGGADQAVYLYSMADYSWWSEILGRELEPGMFGENLTLSEFPDCPVKVGDRLKIGETLLLEITSPRVPCVKLAARMGDSTFGKKFVKAIRPGAYARVMVPAEIEVGDCVIWEPSKQESVGINDIFSEWHKKDWSPEFFKKVLQTPVSKITHAAIEKKLEVQKP